MRNAETVGQVTVHVTVWMKRRKEARDVYGEFNRVPDTYRVHVTINRPLLVIKSLKLDVFLVQIKNLIPIPERQTAKSTNITFFKDSYKLNNLLNNLNFKTIKY